MGLREWLFGPRPVPTFPYTCAFRTLPRLMGGLEDEGLSFEGGRKYSTCFGVDLPQLVILAGLQPDLARLLAAIEQPETWQRMTVTVYGDTAIRLAEMMAAARATEDWDARYEISIETDTASLATAFKEY